MSKGSFHRLFLVAATVLTSTAAFGQFEVQIRARQQPGWDVRAREGRCEIRVWVDNRAEVRMRGDSDPLQFRQGFSNPSDGGP